jgi:Holliday junction DNA helicase RuvA
VISYISGVIRKLNREPASAVVITGGIGYEVHLPAFVYDSLTSRGVAEGSEVEFEVYYHVTERQPKPQLVGFLHESEKDFFEQLIQVEGIGPSKASAALVFPVSTIAAAIENGDTGLLTQLPGIGARAAQKIIATLQGKVAATALLRDDVVARNGAAAPRESSAQRDAAEALINLGYRPAEAREQVDAAVRRNPDAAEDVQTLMREVFRGQAAARATFVSEE